MKHFAGRVAVVTGAASGIGRALSVALAQRGCRLALVDRNGPDLEETAKLCNADELTLHEVDVAQLSQMRKLAEEVERRHGGCHLLINNAGVSVAASFEDHSLEDFEWLMGINFWGVVYGCKLFLPQLLAKPEAHIVNVSSVFGLIGVPMNSSYCASKFAVRGLTESLRAELACTAVGVTSVHPGGVATNIVRDARVIEPEDMVGAHARAVRAFERMLPPSEAARQILRGVERNAPRVLVSREAHVIDSIQRTFPVLMARVIGRHWRALNERFMGD